MPDPTPGAVAVRLARCVVRCVMRVDADDETAGKILGVSVNDIALALDAAGVRVTVENLHVIRESAGDRSTYDLACEALAALTGDDDA